MRIVENVVHQFIRFLSNNVELVSILVLLGTVWLCLDTLFRLFAIKENEASEKEIDFIGSNSFIKVRKALPGLEDGKKALIFANDLVSEEVVVVTQDGRQITVNMNDLKQFF